MTDLRWREFMHDESGATAIEYGLIAALIGMGIIVSLGNVRDSVRTLWMNIQNGLNS
jgi:pilus assembly protein Flp/PilA